MTTDHDWITLEMQQRVQKVKKRTISESEACEAEAVKRTIQLQYWGKFIRSLKPWSPNRRLISSFRSMVLDV